MDELETGELDHCVSASEVASGWNERGRAFWLKGSKGSSSSSSSSGRRDDRKEELGVSDLVRRVLSGVNGAAIASFDVGRCGL